eukprot:XP_027303836.1 diamine acetyltransferase 2-like isoform X2 [Anas platyrhynchos]
MGWEVRACTGPELVRMLREWAALEPGPQPPPEEAQLRDLLGAQPPPVILTAEGPGGVLGGFAVASWGFSTWRGRDLRLGELWVPPALRGQGVRSCCCRVWHRKRWPRAAPSCGWSCRRVGGPGMLPPGRARTWGQLRAGGGSASGGGRCSAWRGGHPLNHIPPL